jgi:hypothetical protein
VALTELWTDDAVRFGQQGEPDDIVKQALHEADLKAEYAAVFLPDQLDRKYKKAAGS